MSAARKVQLPTVREVRFDTQSHQKLKVEFEGKLVTLKNISDTGMAFESSHSFQTDGEGLVQVRVTESYSLKLQGRIIWKRAYEQGHIYGFHFKNHYLPEGFLEAFDRSLALKENIFQSLSQHQSLKPEIKLLTFEIRNFLEKTKNQLDQMEREIQIQGAGIKNSYHEVLRSVIEPEFVKQLKNYSRQLDQMFMQLTDKDLRKQHVEFFRSEVGLYYTSNPFIGRALQKPRGYAGDFEMMNQIYRDAHEGQTFFETLMHRYGIHESSSQSVLYRRGYFCDKILELSKGKKSFTFASMASGPAQEVIELLSRITPEESKKFHIYLIDQDVQALLNAKRNCFDKILSRNLECQIEFVPVSVKQILEKAPESEGLREISFDLIYTAGLYDYLTQPVAQMLTANLSSWIKPGGSMIVGNFHPSNPTKTISELVADWKLIHRTEKDMLGLIEGQKFKRKHLHQDPEGIDLFLEVDF